MGRPRTAPGDWGKISSKRVGPGKFRAWTYVRDATGHRVQVNKYGDTASQAETKVRQAAKELSGKAKKAQGITGDTTVAELLTEYIEGADVAETSRDIYRRNIAKHLIPGLGSLTLRECTTGRLDTFINAIGSTRPAVAKQCRAILSNAFSVAVRHDVFITNPVDGTKVVKSKSTESDSDSDVRGKGKKEPRALTKEELAALRERVHTWMNTKGIGRRRNQDMGDLLEVLAGTGMRIGEVLALRWDRDVDLTSNPATVTIRGHVVRTKAKGLHIKPRSKTRAGHRAFYLPGFTRDVLLKRRVNSSSEYVFPSITGGLRETNNVERQWRDARGEEFAWVTPHSFRKTVGTEIIEKGTDRAAMAQLGHSRISVTEEHYVDKAVLAPDSSSILDALGPTA